MPLGPEPRYLSNYVGLRNRLAVLDEQYPYVDFETRVKGAHNLMLAFLDFLHGHRDEIVALVAQADRATIARGANPDGQGRIRDRDGAHGAEAPTHDPRLRDGGRGHRRAATRRCTRPDVMRTYADVPYLAKYAPKRTVRLPRGYLVTVREPAVVDKLRQHGIAVERLVAPATVAVETFSVTKLKGSEYSDQGHYTSTVEGTYVTKTVTFPPGTWFVSMAQPLATVAAQLLEPESPDGLVTWNFFDRYIAFQWMPQPMEYPVYRVHDRISLVTEAVH